MNNQEKLTTLISVTNVPLEKALSILEQNNWDLDRSLQITPTQSTQHDGSDMSNQNNNGIYDFTPLEEEQEDEHKIRDPDQSRREQLIPSFGEHETLFTNNNIFNQHINTVDEDDSSLLNLIKTPEYLNEGKSFNDIKSIALSQNKHILVSIRSPELLNCIHINRDLWLHDCVKDILESTFCCWQVNTTNSEGTKFCTRYNVTHFPYVAIIEAITGRVIQVIRNTSEYTDFISEICEVIKTINETNSGDKIESPSMTSSNQLCISEIDTESDMGGAGAAPAPTAAAAPVAAIVKKEFIEPTENFNTIRFSFSDNSANVTRKFGKSEKIQILYEYIEQECNKNEFDILNSFPRKSLKQYIDSTLEEMKLNNTTLIIKC